MICKKCGYQNSTGMKYCSGCGRKLHSEGGNKKKAMIFAAVVCLLAVVFGVPKLTPNKSTYKSEKDIAQVLPNQDGSVAVLYKDGTVRVSGNDHFSREVSDWEGVTRLYYDHYSVFDGEPILVGLTDKEVVFTTEEDFFYGYDLKITDLYFPYGGIVGLQENGYVTVLCGDCTQLANLIELSDVKDLLYSDLQDIWCVLKEDGRVQMLSDYTDPFEIYWDNVKEIRDSGHAFYVIKNDGTVVGGVEDSQPGLTGAIKIVDYNDWIFGISADGRLLTHNGGNIYTNMGAMMVDVPGAPHYGGEVDISQFDQIRDILALDGLVLLNEDGTVDAISYYPEWDLSDWSNIEKIYGCPSWERNFWALYGIRKDGTVIRNEYDRDQGTQIITEKYHNWKLVDIYEGDGGVVGLTVDGKLVGDGIYENIDFSVF